jgi:Leucine-rich repeat (LRR) protein
VTVPYFPYFPYFRFTPGLLLATALGFDVLLWLNERLCFVAPGFKPGWAVITAAGITLVTLTLCAFWFLCNLLFRRRFQYSVLSLLNLPLVVAIPFSWLMGEVRQAEAQRQAVKVFRSNSQVAAWVGYDYEYEPIRNANEVLGELLTEPKPAATWLETFLGEDVFHGVVCVDMRESKDELARRMQLLESFPTLRALYVSDSPVTDAELAHIRGLIELRHLDLSSTNVTDAGLEHLEHLTHLRFLLIGPHITDRGLRRLKLLTSLESLELLDTDVTDAGVGELTTLTNLRSLYLSGAKITGCGLDKLKKLTRLEELSLDATLVTDVGLDGLTTLTNLRSLCLSGTNISDGGLKKLKTLARLEVLEVRYTQVTDAGITDFHRAVPRCNVTK